MKNYILSGYGLKGLITKEWDGRTFIPVEEAGNYDETALIPLYSEIAVVSNGIRNISYNSKSEVIRGR